MAESTGDKIEVKTLKNTDLKPEDISKAIDDTAKSVSAKNKSVKTEEPPKSTPAKTSKIAPKTDTPKDESTQVIVKKHGAYMSGAAAPAAVAKPAEDTIEKEPKVELKPPSAVGKTVVTPNEPAEPNPAEPPEPKPDQTLAASQTPTKTTPVESAKPPQSPPKTETDKAEAKPAQQALKTFDTNEYHLPIKPTAGKHYMNAVVSWTILLLFLAVVGGYVVITLEIIDPNNFGF